MKGASVVSLAVLFLLVSSATPLRAQSLGGWGAPVGGWDYVYQANTDEDIEGQFGTDPRDPDPLNPSDSLDGTWHHNNGSDEWDGSGPGDAFRPDGVTPASPGGAGIVVVPGAAENGGDASVLSIVDTGDPRAQFPDPGSNRKTWFCHDVAQEGVNGAAALRTGITFIVRSRLHPDIDPETPGWQLPDGGLDNDSGQGVAPGYTLRDGGKGGLGYYDNGLDRNFGLAPYGVRGYQLPPLVGEGLPPATFLDVGDNTVFHALWITVSDADANDRFDVTVYVDGATVPAAQFPGIQIGDDTDCDGITHLHMGFHSTPQIGGMQVDYFGYKVGLFTPTSSCPGGFRGDFNPASGQVALEWSPGAVDSYTVRRNGAPLQEGIAPGTTTFTDASPSRPSATYELVPIEGGQPKAGCNIPSVTLATVICPVLTCTPDKEAGTVRLDWTAPGFFTPASYNILRDGAVVGSAPGAASAFTDSAPPGEHTYELEVVNPAGACAVPPFCVTRLFTPGSLEIIGNDWDRVAAGGVSQIVITSDGVKSLYFPPVDKTAADTASFAVQVTTLGGGGGAGALGGDRFRLEIQARFDNEVRILNRSASPESYVHFALSRTGTSTAVDENGMQEIVEQVPAPPGGPTVDSASSTIVNTDTIGLLLVEGLNLIDILPVDGPGTPHNDEIQLFALRIGPFAVDLDADLADFPCPSGFACALQSSCGEENVIELSWRSADPHAYEIDRDGALIATIPLGATTSHTDTPGVGFFTYTLRVTDSETCPPLNCTGGGGVPDAEGFIRDWLILGPLEWGCPSAEIPACDSPGEAAITEDYLQGTSGGQAVAEATIEPEEGMDIALGRAGVSVRAAPREELNPGRPGTARWFGYGSTQNLVDANVAFGGDPGSNYMLYGAVYVNNTTGGDLVVDMGLTSDDSVQVYLNGVSVHVNNVARPVGLPGTGNFDVVPGVVLESGLNRILFKVFEGGGGTGFGLRFQTTDQFGFDNPVTEGIEVSLCPVASDPRLPFHRGDPYNTGSIVLTNGVAILNFLFLGGARPPCREAADVNNDGGVNLTDGINIFNYLFLGGPPPTDPGPVSSPCGRDPDPVGSPKDLGCESYTRC